MPASMLPRSMLAVRRGLGPKLCLCRFSCNGGRKHTAAEMVQIGTYNALIGEHAFYSSSNTSRPCRRALATAAWLPV